MNNLIISGNITADATLNRSGETSFCNFDVAVNKKYKNKEGVTVESAQFFRCTLINKDALAPYLKKGTCVVVCGEISADAYIKDGNAYPSLRVKVSHLDFCGGSRNNDDKPQPTAGTQQPTSAGNQPAPAQPEAQQQDSDLPF